MMMRDCLFGEICILNIKYFLTNEEVDVPSVMNETNTPIQINTEIFMRSYLLICFSFRIHMLMLFIFLTDSLIIEQKISIVLLRYNNKSSIIIHHYLISPKL